ncbi:MAG: DUF72 domain-containing protein [bacterium]|nr:DUF72 domain-containing protein [bacterium]
MKLPENFKIGTCGFGRTRKDEFAKRLNCVEIQHTFYNPPQVKTLEKWRAEMPEGFEFTLKAWQMITHDAGTPTYRRLKREMTDKETAEAGSFRPTETVESAWQTTLASANALRARTILFQCPSKFTQTVENIKNLRRFFKRIKRGGVEFAWEPRGKTWDDKTVANICGDLDLRHVVDPYRARTMTPEKIYYRLHGIGGWRYEYEEGELEELASMLPEDGISYVFFNNRGMFSDAVRFSDMLKD